jgi:hypothetical protein
MGCAKYVLGFWCLARMHFRCFGRPPYKTLWEDIGGGEELEHEGRTKRCASPEAEVFDRKPGVFAPASRRSPMHALVRMSAVTTAAGLHLPTVTPTHRPALFACSGLRCAPPCAQMDDEYSSNDDILRDAQNHHFNGDPATPPAYPPIDDERLRRSPGICNNFSDLPTGDFKKPRGLMGRGHGSQEGAVPASDPYAAEREMLEKIFNRAPVGSRPSVFVLLFHLGDGDGVVFAFESQQDAEHFAQIRANDGLYPAPLLSWSQLVAELSKISQICDYGSLEVSLVPRGNVPLPNVPFGGFEGSDPFQPDPFMTERTSLGVLEMPAGRRPHHEHPRKRRAAIQEGGGPPSMRDPVEDDGAPRL